MSESNEIDMMFNLVIDVFSIFWKIESDGNGGLVNSAPLRNNSISKSLKLK